MQAASSPHTRLFPVTRLAILGIASSAIALCCITSPSHAQFGKFLDKAKDAAKKVVPGSASGNAEEPTPSESAEPTSRSEATGAEPETAEPETELVIDLSLPEWRNAPEMTAVSDPEGQFQVAARVIGNLAFMTMETHAEADFAWQIAQIESVLSRMSRKAMAARRVTRRGDDGQRDSHEVADEKIPPRELTVNVDDPVARAALEYVMNQGARRVEMLKRAIDRGTAPDRVSAAVQMRDDDMLRANAPMLGPIEGFSESTTYLDLDGQRAVLSGSIAADLASGESGASLGVNAGMGLNSMKEIRPEVPRFEFPDARRVRLYAASRDADHTPVIALVVDGQLLGYRDDSVDISQATGVFDRLKRSGADGVAQTTVTLLATGQVGAITNAVLSDGDDLCRVKVTGVALDSAMPNLRHKSGAWTITPISAGAPNSKFDMMLQLVNKQVASAMGPDLGLLYMVAEVDMDNPGAFPPVRVAGPDGNPLMQAPYSLEMISSLAQVFNLDPDGRDNPLLANAIIENAVEGRLMDPFDPQSQQRAMLAAQLSDKNTFGVAMICSGWNPQWDYVTVTVGDLSFNVPARPLTKFKNTTIANQTVETKDLASIYGLGPESGVSRLDVSRYSGDLWSKIEEFQDAADE